MAMTLFSLLPLVFLMLWVAWCVAVIVLLYKIYQNTKPRAEQAPAQERGDDACK